MTSRPTHIINKELHDREERDETLLDSMLFNSNVVFGVIVVMVAAGILFMFGMRPLAAVTFARDAPGVLALMCLAINAVPLVKNLRARRFDHCIQTAVFVVAMAFASWFWLVVSGAGFAQAYWHVVSGLWPIGVVAGITPLILTVAAALRVANRRSWGATVALAAAGIITMAAWSGWAFTH